MRPLLKIASLSVTVVAIAGLIACSSGGGAAEIKGLYLQLGAADGVARLANQFGANIASNSTLNTVLDSVAIDGVKTGFTNDVIVASGMTPPSSITMSSALAGKGIDANSLNALTNCLKEAGASIGLTSELMSSLTSSVMTPLSKSLGI